MEGNPSALEEDFCNGVHQTDIEPLVDLLKRESLTFEEIRIHSCIGEHTYFSTTAMASANTKNFPATPETVLRAG